MGHMYRPRPPGGGFPWWSGTEISLRMQSTACFQPRRAGMLGEQGGGKSVKDALRNDLAGDEE